MTDTQPSPSIRNVIAWEGDAESYDDLGQPCMRLVRIVRTFNGLVTETRHLDALGDESWRSSTPHETEHAHRRAIESLAERLDIYGS